MRETRRAPRAFIIAEAGVNHNGRLATALRLVDAAKRAGADAVKFQTFKAEHIATARAALAPYQRRRLGRSGSQLEMIRKLELGVRDHERIIARCRRIGIVFMSTPFDEDSADLLKRLGVRRFKLPSGEITNKGLLQHVAAKGLPMILSTGMADLAEVSKAVGWIREKSKAPLTLLQCVTEYPAPVDQINLKAMATMRAAFGLPVGYSDHTLGIDVAVAAAALGACVIEKHLTLDREAPGPDHAASLEPPEFKAMVDAVRRAEAALGDGVKRPAPCERRNRIAARRSLVAAADLPAGHRLVRADLAAKRPGGGLPPEFLERAVGRRLRRAVKRDHVFSRKDL
jgi:N-acetylneuraminate synthase/N,N'-diacetyllegionaminate synthase